jgi:hypothetical protein
MPDTNEKAELCVMIISGSTGAIEETETYREALEAATVRLQMASSR